MSSWERFKRMYDHREADRIPIIDDPWACTLRRWQREGMPVGVDWCDYFGIDKVGVINIDISPRYPEVTLEETDRYAIRTSPWGVTMKHFKEEDSTPEFLDYKITTPEAWEKAKKRMTLTDDRIPWDYLKQNGGFIFSSNHSIPNSVSLDNMKRIVAEVTRVGRY